MPILSYSRNMAAAKAGLLASSGFHFVVSRKLPIRTHKVTLVITAQNSTAYTMTVNGVQVSYTSDGSATVAEIRDGLIAAAAASTFFSAICTAAASSNNVVLTAKEESKPFTLSVSSDLAATVNAQAISAMPFGVFAGIDGEDKVKNLGSSSDKIAGVLLHSHAHRVGNYSVPRSDTNLSTGGQDTAGCLAGDVANILKRGEVWCVAEETMAPGDAVYARHTASGANVTMGAVRKDADSSKATQVTAAEVLEYNSTLKLVKLSLNLP